MLLILFVVGSLYLMSSSDTYIWNSSSKSNLDLIAGYISGEYACQYNNQIQGTLYAGSKALCFSGTYFLFEKKVVIEWDHVRRVEKNQNAGIDVVLRDETVHVFGKLHAPDRVWITLVSLHNDALLDRPTRSMPPSRSVRRRNSDPLLSSVALTGDDLPQTLDEEEEEECLAPPPARKAVVRRSSTAPSSEETPSKSTQVLEIEQAIGHLRLQPISCSYEKGKGKLYAGDSGLYFEAKKVFFWDNKDFTVKFTQIRQVQIMEDTKTGGIRVVQKEGDVFEFYDMENADQVWASLIALHNEHLADQQSTPRPPRTLRRRNSDPLLSPSVRFDEPIEVEDDAASTGDLPDTVLEKMATTTAPVKSYQNPKEEWTALCQESEYSNVVVQDHVLPCSLDKYFELFVMDNAPYSISKFLEKLGDFNLQESNWSDEQTREVHYTHLVNAPLAPPQAAARKEQRLRRIGDEGICVTTRTNVDDVPMTDCFYVEDRLRVEPTGDESVSVVMEFEIVFVKSTMFKGIISKTTSSEFKAMFHSMAKFMSEALGETPETVEKALILPTVEEPKREPSWLMTLILLLLVLVLSFQIWIMRELRGIKEMMQTLQTPLTCPYDDNSAD